MVVDDDILYREALERNLAEQRFQVVAFADGATALEYLRAERNIDAIVLDWHMPEMSGIDVLRELRALSLEIPVIVLTAFSSEKNEALALDFGAVDFFSKSRSPSILVRRLHIILDASRGHAGQSDLPDVIRIKFLELRLTVKRAFWRGLQVPLTITEFNIVKLLASRAGAEVSYRDIYNVVHGDEFVAGDGVNGYRTNVRALIKRIRQKFRELDDGFGEVENYAGFGYRWRPDQDTRLWPKSGQAGAGVSAGSLHRLARRFKYLVAPWLHRQPEQEGSSEPAAPPAPAIPSPPITVTAAAAPAEARHFDGAPIVADVTRTKRKAEPPAPDSKAATGDAAQPAKTANTTLAANHNIGTRDTV